MSSIINTAVEIGSFGLIDDMTGVEGAHKAAGQAAGLQANHLIQLDFTLSVRHKARKALQHILGQLSLGLLAQ